MIKLTDKEYLLIKEFVTEQGQYYTNPRGGIWDPDMFILDMLNYVDGNPTWYGEDGLRSEQNRKRLLQQ